MGVPRATETPARGGMPYRVKRRAFLAGIGAAFGLKTLLDDLEAGAEGAAPPPRFLLIHWPLGTLQHRFLPETTGSGFTISPILAPFERAGLRDDMIGLFGFTHGHLRGFGGGNEDGTVFAVTGADSPGTRLNGGRRTTASQAAPPSTKFSCAVFRACSARAADTQMPSRTPESFLTRRRPSAFPTRTTLRKSPVLGRGRASSSAGHCCLREALSCSGPTS